MSKDAGATTRVLLSFGVIVGVLGLAIVVAKIIQSNVAPHVSADAEPDAPAELMATEEGGADAEVAASEGDAGVDAAPKETVCDGVAKEVEAAASRLAPKVAGDASDGVAQLPDLFRDAHCTIAKNGAAWAMIPTDVRLLKDTKKERPDGGKQEAPSFETLWDVVHISSTGERTNLPQPPFASGTMQSLDLEEPKSFDFNGDGEEEVILTGNRWVHDGPSIPFGRIWTFKGKKIEPYLPAPEFGAVEDIDDDERPDLLSNGPYFVVARAACNGPEKGVGGPLMAAHAKSDGTFSMSDDAGIAFARKRCPARPTFIVVPVNDGGTEEVDAGAGETSADRLVCARLWGATDGELSAQLTKECKKLAAAAGDAGVCAEDYRGDIVCDDIAKFRPWLKAKPPLLLK